MASKSGQQSFALEVIDGVTERPYHYSFFDVLRYLEAVGKDGPRLGESVKAREDIVFIRQQPSMAFAPSSIVSFTPGGQQQDQIYNWAYGIFGPNGPLPLHLTEYAYEREKHYHDDTLSRFADVFHHRMVSLLYRGWANTQPTIEMDRPNTNKFDQYVGAIAGLHVDKEGTRDESKRREVEGRYRQLFRAGLFNQHVRSADGLETLLSGYFKVPFTVTQFCGDWLPLRPKDRFRLGSYGYANSLGVNSCLGERVYDCQHKFSLSTGVLSIEQFKRLLPGGESYQALYELVTSYMGVTFEWDLTLKMSASETPQWRLGQEGGLGWTQWLGGEEVSEQSSVQNNQQPDEGLAASSNKVIEVQLKSRSAHHYGSEFGE